MITAMELQESQEENSPREIAWLWVSLEKSMPASQLRKESYYLNRSSYSIYCGQREGTGKGGTALLCSAMTSAESMRIPTQVCVVYTPCSWAGTGNGSQGHLWGALSMGQVMLRLLWLIYQWCISKRQRQVFELQAHVVSVHCYQLLTYFCYILMEQQALTCSCISWWKLLSSGALHTGRGFQRVTGNASQNLCAAESCELKHAEKPKHRNGSGYIIRQMPCLMLLTLRCTKGCCWDHSHWQKHLGLSEGIKHLSCMLC